MRKKKTILLGAILSCLLVTIITLAATPYPNGKVVFDGFELEINTSLAEGSTSQAFMDITLKNVNSWGVSYCLKYDPAVIQLSEFDTNKPIENPKAGSGGSTSQKVFDQEHKYFKQNEELFPIGSFKDEQYSGLAFLPSSPIIGTADPDRGYLTMNFLPKKEVALAEDDVTTSPPPGGTLLDIGKSPVIKYISRELEDDPYIKANTNEGVKLGTISFKIVDPVAFAKLTPDELKDVISLAPYSDLIPSATVTAMDIGENDKICIGYFDEKNKQRFLPRADAAYDLKIKAKILDVQPQIDDITVSAYELFKMKETGEKADLVAFANSKLAMLTEYYTDGSQVPVPITWQESDIQESSYNPKEGDYHLKLTHKDKEITVTVHVTPVKLIGFNVDKKDLTYYYDTAADAENPDFPTTFGQLEFPEYAYPMFDTYLPNGGLPGVKISSWFEKNGSSQVTEVPPNFSNGGTFEFAGKFNSQEETAKQFTECKWLTDNILSDVYVTRTVVTDINDMPKTLEVSDSHTDTDGKLHITVNFKADDEGNPVAIPDGTKFTIKMPGGEVIDTDSMGGRYSVTYNADGTADIIIEPDPDTEPKLAHVVNLGGRAGDFAIAAAEPADGGGFKSVGPDTLFKPTPRANIYLAADMIEPDPEDSSKDKQNPEYPNYLFDFSTDKSAMFPVKAGTTLPTTITLPLADQRINTTYDGMAGAEPGKLATFSVTSDGWYISGDINTPGSVIEAYGLLADTDYTNYGRVTNDDYRTVKIKYIVGENDGEASTEKINDFIYNTQQKGYGYDKLQNQTFTVKNNGPVNIYGLSAVISTSIKDGNNDDKAEAFVETRSLPPVLAKGESAEFDISTKIGLPSGEYVSTVSIMSNDKVLQTFKITFRVTDKPVYTIELVIDDDQKTFGTAKTKTETYTSPADELITIIAKPEIDCFFMEWVAEAGDVTFDSYNAETASFTMPESDVKIKAVFKERVGAKLRADDFEVQDTENVPQTLHDKDWKTIDFKPATRDYYVAIDNNSDAEKNKVHLYFKLREEAEKAALTLTHKHGDTTDSLDAPIKNDDTGYYISVDVPLDKSPVENIITLTMTYDDPFDNPDEGEQQRAYIVHAYLKLTQSELIKFKYGNSPFGLIMSDIMIDHDAAKQSFIDNDNTFVADNVTPMSAKSRIGKKYIGKAWPTAQNYDWDETALFVINSEPFSDTGYESVQNSIGQTVTEVKKSIKVNVLSETNVDYKNSSPDDFSRIEQPSPTKIDLPDNGIITELTDKRIRPDCYKLEYTFNDYDGSVKTVSRPIIILPAVGDINIDKNAETKDVTRVIERFKTYLADSTNVESYLAGGLLFRYRVCDASNDGHINAIDANYIRDGNLTPFYVNTTEGGGG